MVNAPNKPNGVVQAPPTTKRLFRMILSTIPEAAFHNSLISIAIPCIGSGPLGWGNDYAAFRTMEAVMCWFFPPSPIPQGPGLASLSIAQRRTIRDVSFIVED